MDKLDYLAQQEEQLRKLNDQLDAKKDDLLKNVEQDVNEPPASNEPGEKKDFFANAAWNLNEPAKHEVDSLEDDYIQDTKEQDSPSKNPGANLDNADEGVEELA